MIYLKPKFYNILTTAIYVIKDIVVYFIKKYNSLYLSNNSDNI